MHISIVSKHAQPVRRENKLQRQSPLTKHNISQATQQRHPFPNRKHTFATAIVVTVAILVCQAAVFVAFAMRPDTAGGPRAHAAEQQKSSDVRWCWHDGSLGHTDRDPVPAS